MKKMNEAQKNAIREFFKAVKALQESGVIRSKRYLGDIGEFLCAAEFGIQLVRNLRQPGHDGHIDNRRVQIKYHGGVTTAINLGNPDDYAEVYVVLGPDSIFCPRGVSGEFLFYRFTSKEVRKFESENGNFFCTERRLPSKPIRSFNLGE